VRHSTIVAPVLILVLALGGAMAANAEGVSVGIHLATTERSPDLVQAKDPDTGERLYVAEEPIVTEAGIKSAEAFSVRQMTIHKDTGIRPVSRPAVRLHLTSTAVRRLSKALSEGRRTVTMPDGTSYEETPWLAIMVDGRVFAVTSVKGRVKERMVLVGDFTEEEAKALAAALSKKAPSERGPDLAR